MTKLYEQDYYGWANEQAALLRAGNLSAADIENIAEEIESMGKGEKRELVNRLIVLLQHLLKWQFQPDMRGRSWEATILVQRDQIASHLQDNPSLKPKISEAMREAFRVARLQAIGETKLPRSLVPLECPYTYEMAMRSDFWPDTAQDAGP